MAFVGRLVVEKVRSKRASEHEERSGKLAMTSLATENHTHSYFRVIPPPSITAAIILAHRSNPFLHRIASVIAEPSNLC